MSRPEMKKIYTMPPGKAEYEYAVECWEKVFGGEEDAE